MPDYNSPGVYLEEIPSSVQPIAGVSTSTPAFIGIAPNRLYHVASAVTGAECKGSGKTFKLPDYPVDPTPGSFRVTASNDQSELENVKVVNDFDGKSASLTFKTAPELAADETIQADYWVLGPRAGKDVVETEADMDVLDIVPAGQVELCTNFTEFSQKFGGFISPHAGQRQLAHAVYGFFNNGGARCYVVRVDQESDIDRDFLELLEPIEEISMIAAPGVTLKTAVSAIDTFCRQTTRRCFAILDGPKDQNPLQLNKIAAKASIDPPPDYNLPQDSDFAALYYPWLRVFDPVSKLLQGPQGDGLWTVPPSGHVAGVYARVDQARGVHKAPANEPVLGVTGLAFAVTKAQQDGLNPHGINCIRSLNGNTRIWGARTVGSSNGEWTYVNVRRLMIYLERSIEGGLGWVVFEPNTPALWARITRNVTAFLTNVWRDGALFGATPQEAFYVKCDAELNPPSLRDLGQVVTEIGVSVVKPAEFVVFRISQWSDGS